MLRLVRPESGLTAVPVPCNGRPGGPQLRSKATVQILPVSGFRSTPTSSSSFGECSMDQVLSADTRLAFMATCVVDVMVDPKTETVPAESCPAYSPRGYMSLPSSSS